MPYKSTKDLPKAIKKNTTKKGGKVVKAVFNKLIKEGKTEEEAFAISQAAAKKAAGGYTKKARKRLGGKAPKKKKKKKGK